MIKNVGNLDRLIRVLVGVVMISYAIFFADSSYSYLGWIGLIPLISGLVGWCGLYSLLGLSTSKKSLDH